MTQASPCVGLCAIDSVSGYCVGCARTGDEIAEWRNQTPTFRAAVWDALPARFATLGVTCRRLPWETGDILSFVVHALRAGAGTWVIGVVGAVAEFAALPGEINAVAQDGDRIDASNAGGALRLLIDEQVRAVTFDPPETPSDRQRVVLAAKRSRRGPPANATLTDLGADRAAHRPEDRADRLFDLGLARAEARFCVRCGPGATQDALAAAAGDDLSTAFPRISPILLAESPARVVESALGRIDVLAPIPPPGGRSPRGPHTHLLLDHLETARALPAGMDLPATYLPGAIFYPANEHR